MYSFNIRNKGIFSSYFYPTSFESSIQEIISRKNKEKISILENNILNNIHYKLHDYIYNKSSKVQIHQPKYKPITGNKLEEDTISI